MTREQVWKSVTEALRPDFGRVLEVRDVRRVRRVAGEAWLVTVVLAAEGGDIHVADLTVEDGGSMSPKLGPMHIVTAVRRSERRTTSSSAMSAVVPDELADFAMSGENESLIPGLDALEEMDTPLDARIAGLIAKGDEASLRVAQDLLPRLLSDHDRQGATLYTMAEVEVKLGAPALARGYLEAAAREFADRFDLNALEKSAAMALEILGRDSFTGSPIHGLLEQSRIRLTPLENIYDARSFAGLDEDLRADLAEKIVMRTLAPGETLVTEGEPSRNVFVVKSGLLGVWLEKPSGGSWLVRCCFPGWLLGESSVLSENALCTASLRAERVSDVWIIPAEHVRDAMEVDEAFALRIAQTKQMHRIDSFFSMHETMGQLDVQVRDEMLSCIQRLETFEEDTVLLPANEIPNVALLVARGAVALYEDGKPQKPIGMIEPDQFYGVRDAIHCMAPSVTAIAKGGTTVAFFDAARLQKLCERSPEQVVAILERLG